MTSLSEHLRRDDHGVLPFHPGCLVCRAARLHGTLPDDALIDRRAGAGVLAALLLGSAGTPPAGALAAPPPPNLSPGDGVDLGGAPLESESGQLGEAPGDPDQPDGPLPPDAGDIPLPPPGEANADVPAGGPEPPAPQTSAPGPPAPPAPAAAPAPQSVPVTPTPPAPEPPPPASRLPEPKGQPERTAGEDERKPVSDSEAPPSTALPAAGAPDASAAAAPAAPPAAAPLPTSVGTAQSGGRHVVRPGETLWSIARSVLGPDASAAKIASYVNRLWSANAQRIGTGDPDLIIPGMELVLL